MLLRRSLRSGFLRGVAFARLRGRLRGAVAVLGQRLARQDYRLLRFRRSLRPLECLARRLGAPAVTSTAPASPASVPPTPMRAPGRPPLGQGQRGFVVLKLRLAFFGRRRGGLRRLGFRHLRLRLGGVGRRKLGHRRAGLPFRLGLLDFLDGLAFELFQVFDEIGDVEEGVAVQPDVYEGRLHPGQDPGDPAFVDAADQSELFLALNVNFDDSPLFQQGHLGLVGRSGNHHLLGHTNSFSGRGARGG